MQSFAFVRCIVVTFLALGVVLTAAPGGWADAGLVPVEIESFDNVPLISGGVLFRCPAVSGSTLDQLDRTVGYASVVSRTPCYSPSAALTVGWSWKDTGKWLRLTTYNTMFRGNPTIRIPGRIRLRVLYRAGDQLGLALGVRETGREKPIGASGETYGPIEWVGATGGDAANGPVCSRLLSPSPEWQTVEFDLGPDAVFPFTGDGELTAEWGVLEHLALVRTGSRGPYVIYVDDVVELVRPFREPQIFHVRSGGYDYADGLSWQKAKATLGAAMTAALPGDQIWVTNGTWPGPLTLKNGVALLGGFEGWEASPHQRKLLPRDPANLALTSRISAGVIGMSIVYLLPGEDGRTLLDGFTFQYNPASPVLDGGAVNSRGAALTIRNCYFANHQATRGGAVFCEGGNPRMERCVFRSCSSEEGSAIYITGSHPVFTGVVAFDCTGERAYAVHLANCTDAVVVSSTIANNRGGVGLLESAATIQNTIFSNNTFMGGLLVEDSTVEMDHNCLWPIGTLRGAYPGPTDILHDPLFANIYAGDLRLSPDSPCINAGYDAVQQMLPTDIDGQPRVQLGRVDIGADEYLQRPPWLTRRGTYVTVRGAVVTLVHGSIVFIQSDDRAWGSECQIYDHDLQPGDRVDLTGRVDTTPAGARRITDITHLEKVGQGEVRPLTMRVASVGGGDCFYLSVTGEGQRGVVGGAGLNNIGLLVTVVGRVTRTSGDVVFVADGSRNADGSEIACPTPPGEGVLVVVRELPAGALCEGDLVKATGVVYAHQTEGNIHRAIMTRSLDDLEVLEE